MSIKCEKCVNHLQLLDTDRHCLVHKCKSHKHITVYGYMDGPIVQDCGNYVPAVVSATERKSLKEATYIRAGGKFNYETEFERSGVKTNRPHKQFKVRTNDL